jgi:hypothetical protein
MKRSLTSAALAFALLGLTAAGARADGAAPMPVGPGPVAAQPQMAPAPMQMAPGAPMILSAPPAGCCAAPACEAPCLKKACIPETATRTNERRVYGEDCEDMCLPKGSLFAGLPKLRGHGHQDCDACPSDGCESGHCASCEHCVRTRKFLVVKIKHEEETYTKCEPGYVPEEPKCRAPLFGH